MNKKVLNFVIFIVIMSPSFSQTGGDNIYESWTLHIPDLSRHLEGQMYHYQETISTLHITIRLFLIQEWNKSLALNYVNYFAGINYGLAMYSRSFPGTGNFATGVTYINYGLSRRQMPQEQLQAASAQLNMLSHLYIHIRLIRFFQ